MINLNITDLNAEDIKLNVNVKPIVKDGLDFKCQGQNKVSVLEERTNRCYKRYKETHIETAETKPEIKKITNFIIASDLDIDDIDLRQPILEQMRQGTKDITNIKERWELIEAQHRDNFDWRERQAIKQDSDKRIKKRLQYAERNSPDGIRRRLAKREKRWEKIEAEEKLYL